MHQIQSVLVHVHAKVSACTNLKKGPQMLNVLVYSVCSLDHRELV